jgi:hypothetical protein
MKIEVKSIIPDEPITGTSKTTGKPYTIHRGKAQCSIDNGSVGEINVKSYNPITAGVYDGKSEEYKGVLSYMLSRPKTATGGGFNGYKASQPKITFAEYAAICERTKALAKALSTDKWEVIFQAVHNCATVMVGDFVAPSGVEPQKITNAKSSDLIKPGDLKDELDF